MTRTGYQLSDIGTELDWGTLGSFLSQLPIDSALHQELHPEFFAWASQAKTNGILADIYDLLAGILYTLNRLGGGKPRKPKPYPRPTTKEHDSNGVIHIGRGQGLPREELYEKLGQKGKVKHASSSIGDP